MIVSTYMDITVKRSTLLKPLQAISGIVEKKQTIPILSNVLLNAQNNALLLTATDMEMELVGSLPLEQITVEGSTTVSGRKLFDICRVLPENAHLHLSLQGNYLMLRSGDSSFSLTTLPPQDFPKTEETVYAAQFTLKPNSFKTLLDKIYFSMGLQDVRHYLNGTLLHINQTGITGVATDGHRLALSSLSHQATGNPSVKIILPRKSVLELMRLINISSEETKEYQIEVNEGRMRVNANDFCFTSKLINTQYPDYRKLIQRGTEIASGNREAIRQALARAAILSNEKFRGVRIRLSNNQLHIMANNMEQEQAEEVVPVEYQGNEMEMGFNVTYLIDVLSSISSENVQLIFSDPSKGVLIESVEDLHSLYVVMPMRL